MADLCSSIELKEKQRGHPQKMCSEDNQVEFEKVNYEQYGFTIQTPPSWQPYDVTSSLVDPNEFPSTPLSDQKVAVLLFSDDSDVFNTEADGFIIIINYFDYSSTLECSKIGGRAPLPDGNYHWYQGGARPTHFATL